MDSSWDGGKEEDKDASPALPTSCVLHRGRYCRSSFRKSSPTCQSAGKHFVVRLSIRLAAGEQIPEVPCTHLTAKMEVPTRNVCRGNSDVTGICCLQSWLDTGTGDNKMMDMYP